MPSVPAKSRQTASRIGRLAAKSKAPAVSPEELATQIATKLTISDPKSKGKAKAKDLPCETSPDECRTTAMRAVNTASQNLAAMEKEKSSRNIRSVGNWVASAKSSLTELRELCPGNIDTERAASSIIGKLVSLELHSSAMQLLEDMRPALIAIYMQEYRSPRKPLAMQLLTLPIVHDDNRLSEVILTLIATFLLHALTLHCRDPLDFPEFLAALHDRALPTLLPWAPRFVNLPPKQHDALFTRAYTAVAKMVSPVDATPIQKFQLKKYALFCLVHTRPGVLLPNTFWDQAVKWTHGYTAERETEEDSYKESTAEIVLHTFEELVHCVERREDRETFLQGQGFTKFCEFWVSWAKQAGDLCTLDRIMALMRSSSDALLRGDSQPSAPSSSQLCYQDRMKEHGTYEQAHMMLEAATVCTALAQAGTLFERWAECSVDDKAVRLEGALETIKTSSRFLSYHCTGISAKASTGSNDIRAKVRRALERLRRTGARVLEPPTSEGKFPEDQVRGARAVLETVADVLVAANQESIEGGKNVEADTDMITPALDSLLILARTVLIVRNPDTYGKSWELLQHAKKLVFRITTEAKPETLLITNVPAEEDGDKENCNGSHDPAGSLVLANYVRCVAGAFHNIAGTLYQADRISHAIRFLNEGCELGRRALVMHRRCLRFGSIPSEDEKERDVDGWRQLEEQLWRRWEILGVCQAKIGDRRLACHAFRECIRAFPFSQFSFEELLRTSTVAAVFDGSTVLKQLGGVVDRVTYIGACDLFLEPSAISAKSWYMAADDAAGSHPQTGAATSHGRELRCIIGALLERQVASLVGSKWKRGVHHVIQQLLIDAQTVYNTHDTPIRRTRVILNALEMEYYGGTQMGPALILGLSMEETEAQVKDLLAQEDIGLDSGLERYRKEYLAKLHLWLALHIHRCTQVEPLSFPRIAQHAEEAWKALRTMVVHTPRQSGSRPSLGSTAVKGKSPKGSRGMVKKPTKKATTTTRSRTGPTRARVNRVKAEPPVTPKARQALNDISLNNASLISPKSAVSFSKVAEVQEGFPQMINLLQMVSHLLGLLGHVLMKVRLLSVARRLSAQCGNAALKEYTTIAMELAHEYVKLGKAEKAATIYSQTLTIVRDSEVSPEIRTLFFSRYAESLAVGGYLSEGTRAYCEAVALSTTLVSDEKGLCTAQRVKQRVANLERAAVASVAFSAIQYARDDPSASVDGLLQSLRLWNRAIDTISRLRPSEATKPSTESDNPFEVKNAEKVDNAHPTVEVFGPRSTFRHTFATENTEWRIVEGLLETLFALSQAYYARGSPREAEYFIHQANDLAKSMYFPATIGRALARNGETLLHLGHLEEGYSLLMQAAVFVADVSGPHAADICRLRGEYSQRSSKHKDAQQLYEEATVMLDELAKTFSSLEGVTASGRKSLGPSSRLSSGQSQSTADTLAPTILAAILRQHISLLRDTGEEYKSLLDRLSSLPLSAEIKAEKSVLMAKLTLDDAYSQFRTDMFLSSLAESAITIPMGMSNEKTIPSSATAQEIANLLSTAERSLWSDLTLIAQRGSVAHVRDTSISLALIRALRSSLGTGEEQTALIICQLIDTSTAITLRREMLEAIKHKFLDPVSFNDLRWRLITAEGLPITTQEPLKRTRSDIFDDSEDESDLLPMSPTVRSYWDLVQRKYQSQPIDAAHISTPRGTSLPSNWTILNISVTEDKSTIFVTRQRAHHKPLVFCLPLKGRRESEDDEHLAFHDVMTELNEILRLNDEGTRRAGSVRRDDKSARAAWWAERSALDKRLQELLQNIEFCWLGAFKTILSAPRNIPIEEVALLRSRIEKIFAATLALREKKQMIHVKLDDALLECFSALPLDCRDEELEDLVYFILDLYQFHGVSVTIAEVDVDQIVVDLRSVLDEHGARMQGKPLQVEDSHMFLALDKNVQGVPWESLPTLRGQSVIRIPNMDFLMDRIELARCQDDLRHASPNSLPEDNEAVVDRITLNPRKTYYVLNPSGDLKSTEGRFSTWLKSMKSVGWDGLIGRVPSEQQFSDALTRNDLMIYFGHGGAEQYIRSSKIRHLPRCAATMLWGCSSGALRDMGDFDRIGTPLNYMLAGCPTLVANLWDVTDRDIDKFSQAVFDDLRLTPAGLGRSAERGDKPVSIVKAVANARDSCKLKYLTGAAPVVYGIPFYL